MNIYNEISAFEDETGFFTYSQIINSADYNRIMSSEHLYISAADMFIADLIEQYVKENDCREIVDLGCGPGRIISLIRKAAGQARLTGVEADAVFANYAREQVRSENIDIAIADVVTYQHSKPVDIFYSQGFHHHMPKGPKTLAYLSNIFKQLKEGGLYILSDEVLPDYTTPEEREERVIVWYSHIIAHALLHGYQYLAQEEAKTLLDDLYEGRSSTHIKNAQQIDFIQQIAPEIDGLARAGRKEELSSLLRKFLNELEKHHNLNIVGDASIDLSRHDYKVCERVLREELLEIGFCIEQMKAFGPAKDIGAMAVYILRK